MIVTHTIFCLNRLQRVYGSDGFILSPDHAEHCVFLDRFLTPTIRSRCDKTVCFRRQPRTARVDLMRQARMLTQGRHSLFEMSILA
jgi:hypothetical protein